MYNLAIAPLAATLADQHEPSELRATELMLVACVLLLAPAAVIIFSLLSSLLSLLSSLVSSLLSPLSSLLSLLSSLSSLLSSLFSPLSSLFSLSLCLGEGCGCAGGIGIYHYCSIDSRIPPGRFDR